MGFHVRTMTRGEVDFAVGLAEQEGWNPGRTDADAFYAADPNGLLIGLLNDEPIGCISSVRCGDGFGFIGLYVVKPEFRGKGFGIQLWNAAIRRLEGCNIGLDGVLAQQDNYRKSGFRLAHRNIRFAHPNAAMLPESKPGDRRSVQDLPEIRTYDRACFPAPRDAFLQAWLRNPTLAAYAEGALTGYGTIRPCLSGHKIGPLFSDDEATAENLFLDLASDIQGPIYLDVPETNTAAVAMAERYGMERVFETARMYTGDPPQISLNRVFGVTTFELG
jgi:GNAT superfamily N-acetyltransferase